MNRELEENISKAKTLAGKVAGSMWRFGEHVARHLYTNEAWRHTGASTFDAFIRDHLNVSPTIVYQSMAVFRNFTLKETEVLNPTLLRLLTRAPPKRMYDLYRQFVKEKPSIRQAEQTIMSERLGAEVRTIDLAGNPITISPGRPRKDRVEALVNGYIALEKQEQARFRKVVFNISGVT